MEAGGGATDLKPAIQDKAGTDLTGSMRPEPPLRIGVSGGNYAIIPTLPPGWTAGSTGAATCVGVIIVYPTGQVAVYHFQGGENAASTMFQTKPGDYPPGTTAMIFGGDNSSSSNFVLGNVVTYLDAWKVGYQYSNTTGMNVDSSGNFFLKPNDDMRP